MTGRPHAGSAVLVRLARLIAPIAFAAIAAGGCGSVRRGLLKQYRLEQPSQEVGGPLWLAEYSTDELFGRLSPDGRRLVYAGAQKGSLDIWIKDLTSGQPQRVTRHVAIDTQPSWAPDGKRLVFVSMREDAKGDIVVWSGGSLRRISDRRTADAYPVFSADGRSVFYAAGPEGQSRIVRQTIDSDEGPRPVTGWGATHPAVSADGHYLAYTRFTRDGVGQIALRSLASGREWVVTTDDYHAGFATFSADGRELLFSRFVRGPPRRALKEGAVASLWRVELARARSAADPAAAMEAARPVTSDRRTTIFAQAHARGIVFTAPRRGSLDIGLMPTAGLVPRLPDARAQLSLAASQQDPWEELLCLERVWQRSDAGELGGEARYRATALWRRLGEFDEAAAMLRRLTGSGRGGRVSREVAELARLDLSLLEIERRARHRASRTEGAGVARLAERALQRLGGEGTAAPPRVSAYRLLRTADMQRLAGRTQAAIGSYERLLQRFSAQRALGAEAKLRLGELFAAVREPHLLASYYLTIFDDYPRQRRWLRRAVAAVFELYAGSSIDLQVEHLRRLIDRHRDKELFCALAQQRIGTLHERAGQLDLAIEAMDLVSRRFGKQREVATSAAFELGRLALEHSEQLRARGRISESLVFYTRAREAYRRVVRSHEPAHPAHQRARAEYIRLSLLEALQLERDGERALAEKRYGELIEFDAEVLAAHRRLITLGVARGERERLLRRYRERAGRAGVADLFIGNYGLGYLATFADPVDEDALEEAERYLRRAVALRPQSPFGHMTLGWVQEMRERHLGQSRAGWLEEAIDSYERAYALNDGEVDRQTEADLLVNLCNAFANLGNGWELAYEYCDKRDKLKLPFLSSKTEAYYRLIFGRSAAATGHHRVASRQLDQGLELARRLGYRRLEGQVLARMALSAHLRGEYRESIRLFRQTIAFVQKQRPDLLAGLTRSIAYNQILLGDYDAAQVSLREAGRLLAEHGAAEPMKWMPVLSPFGHTTAPFGFDALDEKNAERALAGLIDERRGEWHRARRALVQRLANRAVAAEARGQDELTHERLQLQNRLAMVERRLGVGAADERLDAAFAAAEKQQTADGVFEPSPPLFALQVALALNLAEGLQRRLAAPAADADARRRDLARRQAQLLRLEQVREQWVERNEKPLLPERLRLALWSDLAALSLARGVVQLVSQGDAATRAASSGAVSKAAKGGAKPARGGKEAAATAALARLRDGSRELLRAVSLLRRVERETRPPQLEAAGSGTPAAGGKQKAPSASEGDGRTDEGEAHGALAPLWRELSPIERMRWHVRAGLNLAAAATAFVPDDKLADHPSTELLGRLAALCLRHDLGALRFVVAAELALRRRDARAMQAAVDGFIARWPLLLGSDYPQSAPVLRRQVFDRAVRLALQQRRVGDALALAERWERRAFVDDLVALSPAGTGRVAAAVSDLLAAGRSYRRVFDRQDPSASVEQREGWQKALDRAHRRVADALSALGRSAPAVARLFGVEPFDLEKLRAALDEGDALVSGLVAGGRAMLVTLAGRESEPKSEPLTLSIAALRTEKGARRLRSLIAAAVGDAKRVYLDLGRLGLWPSWKLEGREVVLLSGCGQLIDARAIRRPPRAGGLVVADDPAEAKRVAGALGLAALARDEAADPGRLERRLEEAGVLVWATPVRFGGGSAANVRLPLPGPPDSGASAASSEKAKARSGGEESRQLQLGRRLGLRLRGRLLLLRRLDHTPGRQRAERIALARLLQAAGIPSLVVVESQSSARRAEQKAPAGVRQPGDGWRPVAAMLAALAKERLSKAAAGLRLAGDGGVTPAAVRSAATKAIETELAAGAAALGKRRLAEAVEALRHALAAMDVVGGDQAKARDRGLEALARAYTFQEDYGRAVVQQQRLLALRQANIDAARKRGEKRALLIAQARWVQALMAMGWIRLRNDQFDEALKVNAAAIALYKEVGRPLMAGSAYEQRSLIAEKKGDMKEALRSGREALKVAEAKLRRAGDKAGAGARLNVAAAATAVARLLRMRFSDYRRAMKRGRQALDQLAWAVPGRLAGLRGDYGKTKGRLKQASGKQAEALKAKLGSIIKEGQLLRKGLVARVETVLEVARIFGARGDYGGAVKQAEQARGLATASGLAAQLDLANLEMVNNLYYMGAYQRALQVAQAALQRAQKQKNRLRQIQFFNVRGTVFAALGKYREALEALRAALRIAEDLGQPGEVAASHNNIGDALRRAGRLVEAHESFSRALAIDRGRQDKLGISFDVANLGLTERLMGRRRQARLNLNRAIELSAEIGAPLNELKARIGLGRLELDGKDRRAAARQFDSGCKLARKLGLRNWLWRFLLWSARVSRAGGDRAAAKRALLEAVSIVEAQPPQLRPAIGSRQADARPEDVFDELLDLMAVAGDAKRSFELSERLRARSFIDLISKSAPALEVSAKADLERLVAARVELEAARTAAMRARPGSEDWRLAAADIARLGKLIGKKTSAAASKGARMPGLVQVDVWPYARLVPLLRAHRDVTFVSYHPGRERLLVWVLQGERLQLHRVPIGRAKLEADVAALRRRLVRFEPVTRRSRELFDRLLGGLFAEGRLPPRLVVVPAGPLHLLPFAALHDGRDFIVSRVVISQLPSINGLRFVAGPASQPADGSPAAHKGRPPVGPSLRAVSFSRSGGEAGSMPFVHHEALAFGRAFAGARVLLGSEATSAAVQRESTGAGLLHFATHAEQQPDAPLRSSLELADGPLQLSRVFALKLSAELVVLSGCETGLGPLAGADGILGLHQAFLTAGARRVVSSLWRVSDLGTALLMKHFFRRLAAGDAAAAALRAAQNVVRRRFGHPAFWAGFRLDGAL